MNKVGVTWLCVIVILHDTLLIKLPCDGIIGFLSRAGSERKHSYEAVLFSLGHRGQREPQ